MKIVFFWDLLQFQRSTKQRKHCKVQGFLKIECCLKSKKVWMPLLKLTFSMFPEPWHSQTPCFLQCFFKVFDTQELDFTEIGHEIYRNRARTLQKSGLSLRKSGSSLQKFWAVFGNLGLAFGNLGPTFRKSGAKFSEIWSEVFGNLGRTFGNLGPTYWE